jgi:hypothetical protein
MATWNRRVTVSDNNQYLQVDNLTPNPNPPGANDLPDSITTKAGQRPATINYLTVGNGPQLSDLVMKDGSAMPGWLTFSRNGPNLRVTANGGPGTTASYYVRGTYNDAALRTQDPQIHNQ